MTRMLYTGFMNNKPNLPEEIMFGPSYSLRANLKANTWAFVAMLLSLAGDVLLARHNDWGASSRAVIAMVPMLVSALWVRDFARWMKGMDELHQRMTLEACLFATVVTLFIVTTWHLLDQAGFFQAYFIPERLNSHLHFNTASFPISLVLAFYFVGYAQINRRYK
jgi:hypothetical protein